jgi:hypothetical protein
VSVFEDGQEYSLQNDHQQKKEHVADGTLLLVFVSLQLELSVHISVFKAWLQVLNG